VRRLLFGKDRRAFGRRTQTKFAGKEGSYVKSTLRPPEHDIAVDATLHAAALWQLLEFKNTNSLVGDTEDKSGFKRADLAAGLASPLRANYFTVTDLNAELLARIVNSKRE
jgi:Mg-chelatase subunit ChlD